MGTNKTRGGKVRKFQEQSNHHRTTSRLEDAYWWTRAPEREVRGPAYLNRSNVQHNAWTAILYGHLYSCPPAADFHQPDDYAPVI